MTTDEVLALIKEVADRVVTPRFRSLSEGEVKEKTPGDYVTVADEEAERALTEEFLRLMPDLTVVGEEAVFSDLAILDTLADAPHALTIDPIDGTRNFVEGSVKHAVMVAELRSGELTRSWILQPQLRREYVAEAGKGAFCNGVRITREAPGTHPRGASSLRRLHGFDGGGAFAPIVDGNMCAGVDYPMIATGQLDFVVYTHSKPWDHMPGMLILREVGGTVVTLDGTDYDASSASNLPLVAAATPELARQVSAALTDTL